MPQLTPEQVRPHKSDTREQLISMEEFNQIYTDDNQRIIAQFRYAVEQTLDKYSDDRDKAMELLTEAFPNNVPMVVDVVAQYDQGIRTTPKDYYKTQE